MAAGCRIETDRGEAAPLAAPAASDTLRAGCPDRPPRLTLARRPIGRVITRILPGREGLLLATPKGLYRRADGRTVRILPDGKDWALAGGVLARLGAGRIDVYGYDPRGTPVLRRWLPAGRHEAAIALAEGDLFVHSAFHDDALILRRSLADGVLVGRALPVERDLLRTLLEGPRRLHEDEGTLVSDGARVVHVPAIKDPVTVLDVAGGRGRVLELAGGRRGEIRVDGETRRDSDRCRLCVRRIRIEGRVSIVPLYVAAALTGDVLWLVRMDPPGSARAILLRADLAAGEVRAWRLGVPGPPTAIAVARESLVVAADRDLWLAPAPPAAGGAICPLR